MTDLPVPTEMVTDARDLARNVYGEALEAKSSDAFCLNLLRARQPSGGRGAAFLEAVLAPVTHPSAPSLIEFAPETVADPASSNVSDFRTAAYQALSAVYVEVERQSGLLARGEPLVAQTGATVLTTQICWLNQSMRTWADPGVVAEVAGDPTVATVDVPRLLRPDLPPSQPVQPGAGPADPTGRNGHVTVGLRDDLELAGRGVVVAVIDSEVASQHPALAGRVVQRRNYTNEPWGNPSPHGTAVASIIAADDTGFPGIAPAVTIYNYKVLASNMLLNADDFGGALAIQQALEDGAAVANCSWGAGPATPVPGREARAVDAAWALGMAVVKSAGNSGPGGTTMTTPADAQGVIVVGATDLGGGSVQAYSSRGPMGGRPGPHVVAPGGELDADASRRLRCALMGGGFGDAGAGTSYAAPFVTGAVALHLEAKPGTLPDQVRDRLVSGARPLDGASPDAVGNGMLQVGL